MNIKQLVAAVSLLAAAGSVFAQQTEFVAPDAGFVSNRSRAEVAAEVKQAQAEGQLVTNDAFPSSAPEITARRSRSDVRATLQQNRQIPDVNDLYFGA